MHPPASAAALNSNGAVLFEVNMMSFGPAPSWRASSSSGTELQSKPNPSSSISLRMAGLGFALTAKYSLNGMSAKALVSLLPVSMMPASS